MSEENNYQLNAVMIAHASEIGIKSRKTRQTMIISLHNNISKKLSLDQKIRNIANRSILLSNEPEKISKIISKTSFGVSYSAPIYFFEWDNYSNLLSVLLSFSATILKKGDSFGLDGKSVGKDRPSITQIKKDLGSILLKKFNNEIKVNLDYPDHKLVIEVRHEYAWIYKTINKGIDGFPQGTQRNTILTLLRPWVNDYLASFLIMRRGVTAQPLRFLTDKESDSKIELIHENFVENFFYKKVINIPILEILENLKPIFANRLCTACTYLTETFASEYVKFNNIIGFTSGTQISNPNADITYPVLAWFDKKRSSIAVRPCLYKNDKILELVDMSVEKNITSCCSLVEKKYISSILNETEIKIVEKEVNLLIEKFGVKKSNRQIIFE